ncbi:hypothetical protein ACFFUP_18670 [Vibrio ostreicida]|uniref:Uncharacterized protein n=1 Tax=Vibrio ostreicida TaxID=526588 RepID=A0ABT8C195_9VIBR|nr:hypothetical protein [Vibrio ostreicida]MDN3612434.1 hypothetical protein [Vibrio ostreicida]NPD09799.1 hypothetical protein [Vibrio ostreicida]
MRTLVFLISITFSFTSFANVYKCMVLDGTIVDDNGKLSDLPDFYRSPLNKEFIVDKSSGKISSKTFNNHHADRIEVLAFGSKENSFKSISYYQPNTKIDYLVVNEHNESQNKSFTYYHAFGAVYSGTCVDI